MSFIKGKNFMNKRLERKRKKRCENCCWAKMEAGKYVITLPGTIYWPPSPGDIRNQIWLVLKSRQLPTVNEIWWTRFQKSVELELGFQFSLRAVTCREDFNQYHCALYEIFAYLNPEFSMSYWFCYFIKILILSLLVGNLRQMALPTMSLVRHWGGSRSWEWKKVNT